MWERRLAYHAGTLGEPSDPQIVAFSSMIDSVALAPANHHASVKGEMDDWDMDGTMLVSLTEDGATQMCRIGRDGKREGDWF